MKVSKIKRPNRILKYLKEQNTVLSEIAIDLKILDLKFHKKIKKSAGIKSLKKIIGDIKKEIRYLRKVFNKLYEVSVKYKIKWFNTYKLSLRAGIIRRQISIVHKHLLTIIKHNKTDELNVIKTVESLKKNYRAFLLINSQAKSLVV